MRVAFYRRFRKKASIEFHQNFSLITLSVPFLPGAENERFVFYNTTFCVLPKSRANFSFHSIFFEYLVSGNEVRHTRVHFNEYICPWELKWNTCIRAAFSGGSVRVSSRFCHNRESGKL